MWQKKSESENRKGWLAGVGGVVGWYLASRLLGRWLALGAIVGGLLLYYGWRAAARRGITLAGIWATDRSPIGTGWLAKSLVAIQLLALVVGPTEAGTHVEGALSVSNTLMWAAVALLASPSVEGIWRRITAILFAAMLQMSLVLSVVRSNSADDSGHHLLSWGIGIGVYAAGSGFALLVAAVLRHWTRKRLEARATTSSESIAPESDSSDELSSALHPAASDALHTADAEPWIEDRPEPVEPAPSAEFTTNDTLGQREVGEFCSASRTRIPLAPGNGGNGQRDTSTRPWHRFLARMIDTSIVEAVIVVALVASASFGQGVFFAANPVADALIMFALSVPFHALLLGLTGTTAGKWLMGIHAKRRSGEAIGFIPALRREMHVWLAGLGLGLPLVSLITMVSSYSTLKKDRVTAWDRDQDWVITHERGGTAGRLSFSFGLFVLILLRLGLLAIYGADE